MTDARYPERWLNDRRILRLTDAGHRLFVLALAWSVSNRTDGTLQADDLRLIPGVDPSRASELVDAGLWTATTTGWDMEVFTDTQTTAAQLAGLDHKRAVDRARQARHRSKGRGTTAVTSAPITAATSRVTEHVTQRLGQDRPRTGELDSPHSAASQRADEVWGLGYET